MIEVWMNQWVNWVIKIQIYRIFFIYKTHRGYPPSINQFPIYYITCPTTQHPQPCANKTKYHPGIWTKMNSSTIVMFQNQKTTLHGRKGFNFQLPVAIWQSIDRQLFSRNKLLIWKERLISFWCIIKNLSLKNNDIDCFMTRLGRNQVIAHSTPIPLALWVKKTILSYKNYETSWKSPQKHMNKNWMTPTNPAKSSKSKSKPSQRSSSNWTSKTKTLNLPSSNSLSKPNPSVSNSKNNSFAKTHNFKISYEISS